MSFIKQIKYVENIYKSTKVRLEFLKEKTSKKKREHGGVDIKKFFFSKTHSNFLNKTIACNKRCGKSFQKKIRQRLQIILPSDNLGIIHFYYPMLHPPQSSKFAVQWHPCKLWLLGSLINQFVCVLLERQYKGVLCRV